MSRRVSGTVVLVALALAPVVMLARAWALATTWGWFVVPLGAPAVGVVHAAGLLGVFGLAAAGLKRDDEFDGCDENEAAARVAGHAIGHVVVSLLSVGLGWVLARWM